VKVSCSPEGNPYSFSKREKQHEFRRLENNILNIICKRRNCLNPTYKIEGIKVIKSDNPKYYADRGLKDTRSSS
jgi:hypothetical protein